MTKDNVVQQMTNQFVGEKFQTWKVKKEKLAWHALTRKTYFEISIRCLMAEIVIPQTRIDTDDYFTTPEEAVNEYTVPAVIKTSVGYNCLLCTGRF